MLTRGTIHNCHLWTNIVLTVALCTPTLVTKSFLSLTFITADGYVRWAVVGMTRCIGDAATFVQFCKGFNVSADDWAWWPDNSYLGANDIKQPQEDRWCTCKSVQRQIYTWGQVIRSGTTRPGEQIVATSALEGRSAIIRANTCLGIFVKTEPRECRTDIITKPLRCQFLRWQMDDFICEMQNE